MVDACCTMLGIASCLCFSGAQQEVGCPCRAAGYLAHRKVGATQHSPRFVMLCCHRERDRDTDRERDTDTDRDTHRHAQTHRHTDTDTHTDTHTQTQTQTHRTHTDTQTHTQTHTDTRTHTQEHANAPHVHTTTHCYSHRMDCHHPDCCGGFSRRD